MCKCYFKTSADKQQLSFTYPKSEECAIGNTVLKWLRDQNEFLAINISGNCQVLLLVFPVMICDENPHYYPSAEALFSPRVKVFMKKHRVLTTVCNIYKINSFCFTVKTCYNANQIIHTIRFTKENKLHIDSELCTVDFSAFSFCVRNSFLVIHSFNVLSCI